MTKQKKESKDIKNPRVKTTQRAANASKQLRNLARQKDNRQFKRLLAMQTPPKPKQKESDK